MTDIPENMEAFNRVALLLFSRLYDAFPKGIDFENGDATTFAFDAVPEDASEEQGWNIGTLGVDVIDWLAEEGFLRYEADPNRRAGYFYRVRLTLKGLAILGCVPAALRPAEEKEALILKVKRALKSGAGAAAGESIKLVVSEIFKLALAPQTAIGAMMVG